MHERREQSESSVSNVSPAVCSNSSYKTKRTEKAALIISIMQIVIGASCMVAQSVVLFYGLRQYKLRGNRDRDRWYDNLYDPRYPNLLTGSGIIGVYMLTTGLWFGAFFIAVGMVGIFSVKKNHRGLIIGMMVMNILNVVGSGGMIFMQFGLIGRLSFWNCEGYDDKTGRYTLPQTTPEHHTDWIYESTVWDISTKPTPSPIYFNCDKIPRDVALALTILMTVLSLINGGIAMSLSIVGCCYTCNCCRQRNQAPPYQMIVTNQSEGDPQHFMTAEPGAVFSQPGGSQAMYYPVSVPSPNHKQTGQANS